MTDDDHDLGEGFALNPDAPNHGQELVEAEYLLRLRGRSRDMDVLARIRALVADTYSGKRDTAGRLSISGSSGTRELWVTGEQRRNHAQAIAAALNAEQA
jgi:hypothetical protein